MKNSYILLPYLISLFLIQPLIAQHSIGFSDSTDFQHIIDYRLPDWGYSNFYLETGTFRAYGNYFKNNSDPHPTDNYSIQTNNQTRKTHDIRINLAPAYRHYRESEKKIISLRTQLGINSRIYDSNSDVKRLYSTSNMTDTTAYEQDSRYKSAGSNYYLDFDSRHFLSNNFFLLTAIEADIQYEWGDHSQEDTREGRTNSQTDDIYRLVNVNPEIGFGFGRLRNIAPQLRAIRFNERYKTLGESQLSNNEIKNAAEHFTKIQGYQRTTDRYQKYFWGDMNELVSGKLDEIETYDLFYLRDVLNESLGQRLEGYEISLSGIFNYYNRLEREDITEEGQKRIERDIYIRKSIISIATLKWYKNLNLNHQLSFISNTEFDFPLEKESNADWTLESEATIGWLWTITDRYLLTTYIQNIFSDHQYKERFSRSKYFINRTYLSGSLSYFIENRIELTGRASVEMQLIEDDSDTTSNVQKALYWRLNAGIRYYFARNLF